MRDSIAGERHATITRAPPIDAEGLEEARREATRQRLMGLGVSEATDDAWIAAWAKQAALDGVEAGTGYWDAAWHWIEQQRRLRTRP